MYFVSLSSLIPEFIRNFKVRGAARKDAKTGQWLAQFVVGKWIRKMPVFSPATNKDHERIQHNRTLPTAVADWALEKQFHEDALTKYPSIRALWSVLGLLYVTEVFGDIQLLMILNVEGFRRTIMSVAFAFFIFFITWQCTTKKEKSAWGVLSLVAYALIVLAIAIVQLHGTPVTDDATLFSQIAGSIVMACTTVGPAVVAHFVIEQLAPALVCLRNINLQRRRISEAIAKQQRAEAFVTRIERLAEAWSNEAEQIVSEYAPAFARAGGTIPEEIRTRLGVTQTEMPPMITEQPVTGESMVESIPATVESPYRRRP